MTAPAPPPAGAPTHADAWFRKGQGYLQTSTL
jgi:hypothetical protein